MLPEISASPFSEKPYYPMLLANGADAVLADYSGSMFGAVNGHSHFEPHQGTPCGWYKVAHAWKTPSKVIQSVAACGYQILMNGEVCEPKDFRQTFDPRRAMLSTTITSFGGCKLLLESFLTDESVLVERFQFLDVPENRAVDLTLLLLKPNSMAGAVALHTEPEFKYEESTVPNALGFSYRMGDIRGYGLMHSDKPGAGLIDSFRATKGFIFKKVTSGWEVTRYIAVLDSTETAGFREKVHERISACLGNGFGEVRKAHAAVWEAYFGASDVSLPDPEFGYLYQLSRYLIRAHLHPQTGGLTVGMLPNLWDGGTYVPYDAWYLHQALLLANNLETADRHLDYYAARHDQARKIAAEVGASGAAFSGWTTCFGEHKGDDIKDYLLHLKPCMAGFVALAFYWQWKYAGTLCEKKKAVLHDVLQFSGKFVVDRGEWAEIAPCMAGNESSVDVQNDSMTSLVFAKAFAGAAEVFGAADFKTIAEKLGKGLARNYDRGLLQPFPGAWYRTGFQFWAYLCNLPDGIDGASVYQALEFCRTPWGYDFEQPSEVYRDWPWIASRAAICLAHLKDPQHAFALLMHQKKHTSSLGAIPEKIRLDGFPIGYWYASPHGLLMWATLAALVHVGPRGEVRLLWGMDGTWQDLSFRCLRLPGGMTVSAAVAKGTLTELRVSALGREGHEVVLDINPLYRPGQAPSRVQLSAGAEFSWRS